MFFNINNSYTETNLLFLKIKNCNNDQDQNFKVGQYFSMCKVYICRKFQLNEVRFDKIIFLLILIILIIFTFYLNKV